MEFMAILIRGSVVVVCLLSVFRVTSTCQQIVFQEGVLVTWFQSRVTGYCMNVVPYHSEWFHAYDACQAKLGRLSPMNYVDDVDQLHVMIVQNPHLQNWTFWINGNRINSSDAYFYIQRNMGDYNQVLYIPYNVHVERMGFICEYDLMNPDKRISLDGDAPTMMLFMGCYIGFIMVLMTLMFGMVAVINNRREKEVYNKSY